MSTLTYANISRKINPLIIAWIFFSIVISVSLLREVLWNPGLPYTRDLVFPYDLQTFGSMLDAWDEIHSHHNAEINKIPLYFLFSVGSDLFGSEYTIKLFFVIVLFLVTFVPFVSIYILFKDRVKSMSKLSIICIIPSLLYLLNPWVVDRISNHIYMVFGMAFTPLILVLYTKLIEKKGDDLVNALPRIIALTLLLTVSSFSTHNLLYIIPLIVIAGVYYYFTSAHSHKRWVVTSTIAFLSLYLVLNSYWIWQAVNSFASGAVEPSYVFSISEIERLSQRNTPYNVFQMIGGGAWQSVLIPPSNEMTFLAFLIPVLSIAAVLLYPKDRFVLLVGILFVLSFLLSLGTNSPIPIYEWLLASPASGIAWLLRDPSRLIQYTALTYSLLLPFTLYRILQIGNTGRKLPIKSIFVIVIAASVLTTSAASTFFNNAGNRLVSSQLPSEYDEVREILSNDLDDFKVWWLPSRQYQFYEWNKITGEVSSDVYVVSSPKPTIYSLSTLSSGAQFWNYLYSDILLKFKTDQIGRFLSLYGIKYIVVHKDLVGWQEAETNRVLNILSFQKDIELKHELAEYSIFLNKEYDNTHTINAYALPIENLEQFIAPPQLESNSLSLEISNIDDWRAVTSNNRISTESLAESNEELIRWDTTFVESQDRYEIRLNVDHLNVESFDKLSVDFLPTLDNSYLSVILYTSKSNFVFTHNNLEADQWRTEMFDLRASKIAQAVRGGEAGFEDITGIGFVVFKRYYDNTTTNTIYIRGISFISDSVPPFNSNAMLESWSAVEKRPEIISEISQAGSNRMVIKVEASEPYILAVAEAYDPLWRASIKDGESTAELTPIPLYAALTGFAIDKTGRYEIELYYAPQQWFYHGSIVSILAVAFMIYVLYSIRRGNTAVLHNAVRRLTEGVYNSRLLYFVTKKSIGRDSS